MIDARKGIIPKLGNNDLLYRNKCGESVASVLIQNHILPPKEWLYDLDYKYYDCKSLKVLLRLN